MIDTIQNKKEISKKLKERAIIEGFTISGIASIPGSSRIKLRTNALNRWLANNHHAGMKWMEAERRKDISFLLEDAKSILSVGFTYINSHQNNNLLKVGKFGQGDDYHKVIYKKLKNIGKWINREIPDCKWKICVDTSPLLEKAWAEESGLGWIGKNSNLINQKNGSWFTLGFMILTEELLPDKPHPSLCGKCDICQDICPWNKSVPYNNTFETTPKEWIKNLDVDSLSWDNQTWEENLKGTTLKRIKPWMWKRNIKANLKIKN